ncbi:glycosyltransferase [Methylophilales bacterium]|nr:glycosyltransferase [Methylophilales bacterium]
MNKVKLSIVITTRNRELLFRSCLESIINSNLTIPYEVIVVDDASSDGTKKFNKNEYSRLNLVVIRNKQQKMMVRSRNLGARKAKGKLVLFVDDDNEVDIKMIDNLIIHLENNPKLGIVGPSMYHKGSNIPYLTSQKINFFTGKTKGLNSETKKSSSSDGIPNVFMIKKIALEKNNYFDERIVQTFTEPDFAFSAREHGYKCEMILSAKTFHNKIWGHAGIQISNNNFRQKAYYIMRNRILFVSRYGSLGQKIIFNTFFSWVWPFIYSFIALRYFRFDLIVLYWVGFADGLKILFSGRIDSNEKSVSRVRCLLNQFPRKNKA